MLSRVLYLSIDNENSSNLDRLVRAVFNTQGLEWCWEVWQITIQSFLSASVYTTQMVPKVKDTEPWPGPSWLSQEVAMVAYGHLALREPCQCQMAESHQAGKYSRGWRAGSCPP